MAGAFIGGTIGLSLCDCFGAGSGDSIGAVVGVLFTAVGGGIGLILASIGAGVSAIADAVAHKDPSEPEDTETWVHGGARCPHSGLWVAQVADNHPLSATFNVWNRTAKVTQGKEFPNPSIMHPGVAVADVCWRWVEAIEAPGERESRVSAGD